MNGGITAETDPLVVEAEAQVLIAGSAIYKGEPEVKMRRIIETTRRALTGS